MTLDSSKVPPESYFEEQAALQLLVPRAKLLAALADALGAAPTGSTVTVPRAPTAALLRPFINCPEAELPEAWEAMLRIAATMAGRAVPPAAPGEIVKAIREYLGVHPDLQLGGQVLDSMALELSRIALDYPADLSGALALEELMQLGYTVEAGAILPPRDLPEQACQFFGVRPVGRAPAAVVPLPAEPGALAESIRELDAWADRADGESMTASESESVLLVLHELRRLRSQTAAVAPFLRQRAQLDQEWSDLQAMKEQYRLALSAQGKAAEPALTPVERQALQLLCAVAVAAHRVSDDSPYDGPTVAVGRRDMEALVRALDSLEDLPDDQPGRVMGPVSKAEWALRRLLDAAPLLETPAAAAGSMPADPTEEMLEALMAGEDRLRARHGDEQPKRRAKERYHALLALAAAPTTQAAPALEAPRSSPRNDDDRVAFKSYLQECDACEIVADVAGAFHAGWAAANAAPALEAPAAPAGSTLRSALERAHAWMDGQADAQSKGGHATFDMMMLREERDAIAAALAAAPQAPAAPAGVVGDMAALVKQLVQALRKAAPNHVLPAKALDYLRRQGLLGSPLRSAAAIGSQPSAQET